jgi:ParE toxin of type II toxin-antitoxin system, parDE
MAFKYKLIPAAQEEYGSSVSWYLKRSLKAATNFVNAVDKGFLAICSDPKRHRNEYKNYYEFNVQKYPFTIIYAIDGNLQL